MNWYYVDQGKQAGPVDDAQLEQLRATGQIQDQTLIWCEGMANWQAYQEIKGGAPAPAPASGGLRLASSAAATAAAPVAAEAACVECGNVFSKENMIRYGNNWVCANCKPVFVQKLAEGAQLSTGEMRYAGFWIRFRARFVDGLVLWVVNMIISVAAGAGIAGMSRSAPTATMGLQFVLFGIQMAIALSYETLMVGKYGATLGKMACKIHVVTADGAKVSYPRSLGRYFSTLLSGLTCTIGYIIAAFDDEKRALHDRICNTRVIYKN